MKQIIHVYTHWIVLCGWCGKRTARATDGRMIFCRDCRR